MGLCKRDPSSKDFVLCWVRCEARETHAPVGACPRWARQAGSWLHALVALLLLLGLLECVLWAKSPQEWEGELGDDSSVEGWAGSTRWGIPCPGSCNLPCPSAQGHSV